MRNRKNVAFGSAVLVAALAFGVGANQWLEPATSWAADAKQIFVDDTAAAALAEVEPSQALFADLYDQVSPSVVNIQVTMEASQDESLMPGLPFGNPFGDPFGEEGNAPVQAQGSGFIYDNDGHIVTNNHVVENATDVTVYFSNGMWAEGEVVATDPAADLAVIKVTPPDGVNWQPLPLAAANGLRVGYSVVALGSPFGLQETLTAGVVSALGRSLPIDSGLNNGSSYSLPDLIQTDTAINPGNSGGPLLNLNGEVVGVNFAINSTSGSNSGVGFAIPVSVVEKIVPALINDGGYTYSYLGIAGTSINASVVEEQKLGDNTLGVYVAQVVSNGPADEAGVQEGDIIVAINDQPVSRFEDLISYLFRSTTPDQAVTLHLLRGGEAMDLDVTVAQRPQEAEARQGNGEESEMTVGISEAIRAATTAVRDADLMDEVESASAKADVVDGRPVWIVTLTDQDQSATVTVDGATGEVLELNVD